jgi:hypothetical protein
MERFIDNSLGEEWLQRIAAEFMPRANSPKNQPQRIDATMPIHLAWQYWPAQVKQARVLRDFSSHHP